MSAFRRGVTLFLALSTLTLVGCTTAAPEPAAPVAAPTSAASTPTPTPAKITTLQFSGSNVRAIDSGERVVDSVEFAEGSAAVVALVSDALAIEPTVSDNDAQCAAANSQYTWDGLIVTQWVGTTEFITSLGAPRIGEVRIETTGGFAVGDDVSALITTLPEQSVSRLDDDVFVAFDTVSTVTRDDYTSPVGSVGYVEGGSVLSSIITPGEWSSFYC